MSGNDAVLPGRILRRPKPKEEDVAEDWDADSDSGDGDNAALPAQEAEEPALESDHSNHLAIGSMSLADNDWPEIGRVSANADKRVLVDDQSRSVWQNANTASAKQGVILMRPSDTAFGGRTLPAAVFGKEGGISDGGVPKILRRESPAGGARKGGSAAGAQPQSNMTLEEREKAYAEARARIFGTSATTEGSSSASSLPRATSPSGNTQSRSQTRQNRGGRGGGKGGREASRSSSSNSSPATTPAVSRSSSVVGEQQPPQSERYRALDGTRQPRGPQEGSAGFIRR